MVVKVYISGISGNKEVKKRQQRVLMILDSKNIKYDVIDITEPGREAEKDFMQNNSKSKGGTVSDPDPRHPLPPQIFNDDEYCGDYDQFDLSNEVDTLEQFLKVEPVPEAEKPDSIVNGKHNSESEKEGSLEKDTINEDSALNPENQETLPENGGDEEPPKKDISEKVSKDNTPEPNNDNAVDESADRRTSSREASVEISNESEKNVERKKDITDSENLINAEKSAD